MRKNIFVWIMCTFFVCLLCSCGQSKSKTMEIEADRGEASSNYGLLEEEAGMGVDSETYGSSELLTDRKQIQQVTLDIETKTFDTFIDHLEEEVSGCSGYVENSSIDGQSYRSSETARYAWFTLRLPVTQMNSFIEELGNQGNITHISKNTEDVTSHYVDLEGRIKSLNAQMDRLNELMGQAESMEDILAIESKMADVRYELESYESQIKTYDQQIEYGTVYLNLQEVSVISANGSKSVWEQIQSGFLESIQSVGNLLRNAFVTIIVSIPYLFVIGIVLLGIRFGIRRWKKARQKKK